MTSRVVTWSLVLLGLSLTGCTGLIVREDDSALQKGGKVVARAVLFVPTVGMSEATIYDLKEAERFQAWKNQTVVHQATEAERRAYLIDQKLLNVSELAPHELIAILVGDIFGASTQLADVLVFFLSDADARDLRYLPPPTRALYPPIDRRQQ